MAMQRRRSRAPQAPHPQEDHRHARAPAPDACSAAPSTSTRRSSTTARARRWPRLDPREGLKEAVEGNKTDAAKKVGALIAKTCIDKNIKQVVFDRNGYLYHGRVKALADAAREAGLKF